MVGITINFSSECSFKDTKEYEVQPMNTDFGYMDGSLNQMKPPKFYSAEFKANATDVLYREFGITQENITIDM